MLTYTDKQNELPVPRCTFLIHWVVWIHYHRNDFVKTKIWNLKTNFNNVHFFPAISLASARGARGGGARFSSRGRYSGSSSRSYRSSFSGNRLSSSSSIRSALLLGTVYGATRYRMRARYRADGTREYYTVNVVYNGIEYIGPDTGLMAHVSTTQSM